MRVQFNYSERDLNDAGQRFARQSVMNRGRHWREFVAIVIPSLLWACIVERERPGRIIVATLVGTSIFYIVYPMIRRWLYAPLVAEDNRRELGDERSHICEVELRPDGVWVRQSRVQHLFEWESVAEIVERSDAVEIFAHKCSGVIVRKRAFASEEEQREFVELARSRMVGKGILNSEV